MTATIYLPRVMTSCAVLCIATSAFAQNYPTSNKDVGEPIGEEIMENSSKCPVMGAVKPAAARHTAAGAMSNSSWWPSQLNLRILHKNSAKSDPMGQDFNYAEEFKQLDLAALKNDIEGLMTNSQD